MKNLEIKKKKGEEKLKNYQLSLENNKNNENTNEKNYEKPQYEKNKNKDKNKDKTENKNPNNRRNKNPKIEPEIKKEVVIVKDEENYILPTLIDQIDVHNLEKTNQLKKEKYYGNIEYKLKLVSKSSERIQELATQMCFRLEEGNGECIYVIGVEDDGNPLGISEDDMRESLKTLEQIAKKLEVELNIFYWGLGKSENSILCQVSGSKKMEEKMKFFPKKEIKIGFLGESDTGKSTLVNNK